MNHKDLKRKIIKNQQHLKNLMLKPLLKIKRNHLLKNHLLKKPQLKQKKLSRKNPLPMVQNLQIKTVKIRKRKTSYLGIFILISI